MLQVDGKVWRDEWSCRRRTQCRVWSPWGDWQALQWNLSRYEDKLEQSDPADQECLSVSDVILLMLALYTVLHISLYLEQCDKDRLAKKKRRKKKKADKKSKMSVSQRWRFSGNREREKKRNNKRKLNSLCFLPLLNTCKNALAHLLCFLHLSVVRCNTWVSRKQHESSWGKCLLICFRYCFIAVSSLTSSVKLPPHTEGSLYLTGIPQAQISKQH